MWRVGKDALHAVLNSERNLDHSFSRGVLGGENAGRLQCEWTPRAVGVLPLPPVLRSLPLLRAKALLECLCDIKTLLDRVQLARIATHRASVKDGLDVPLIP